MNPFETYYEKAFILNIHVNLLWESENAQEEITFQPAIKF